MLDQSDYRTQLDEYLKRQRAKTGQGRIDASKLGEDPEVKPIEPGAMPEPTGFLKFLQPFADVLGRYTRPIAGLAETVFGKATKEIVRFKAGDQAADEYEAERERIWAGREARAETLGGGLGGFLGATGETLDEMSNLKDRRPELVPFEKFVEDLIVDPTTYMGFGLGTALSKLPHVGKAFKPLELVLDVAPQQAWKQTFGRASKAAREAIEASEPIGGIKARLFTETARSKATRAADDIRSQWNRFVGAKDVLDDELLNKPARAGLDALMTLAQDGGKVELPEAVAVLKTLHQGNEREALGAAGRLLTTFDDVTEIEKLKYMTVGQVGDWLAAHTYGSVRKLYDARLLEMKAQSSWATKASLMLMEPSANRPMGWAYRWFVMEPARAVLSFANYGPFNVIEDTLRIAESGTAVDVLDKIGLDWSTAGLGAPGFIAGKRVSELALIGEQGVEEVPSLLSWWKGWPGKPLAWWNAKAARYSEDLRRGAVVNHWRDDMMKSVAANPALMTPELRQALDDIPQMLPGIPKQARHTAQTVATILALRGEHDAMRMLPTMFSRQALNIQKADDIIAALPQNLPLSAKSWAREKIKAEGFAAVSTPEKQNLFREGMLDAVEKDLPLDPKYVGEGIDEMLAAGEAATPQDLSQHIEKILGAGLPRWAKWDGIMRDLLAERGSKYHMGQQHAWFADAMKGGADKALEQSKRLRALVEKMPEGELRQAQLDTLKAFETPWETHSKFVYDLTLRFFPPDAKARELGFSTGVKGLKTWTPIMNDIALGKIERIAELPKEWGAAIIRRVPEWIQLRDAGQLDTKGIVANIEREGYQALYDTKALVASEQLGMNVFEKLLNKLARTGAAQGDAAIGPEVREMLGRIAKEADEAVLPAVDRDSNMWTESVKDIESIIDKLYSGLRKDAISVEQETAMRTYFNGLADTIAKIPDETRKAMSDNALRSWKDSQNWFHDIFPNYSHETTFDSAMKLADPFWIYQSRSWPYLIRAAIRKPSLAVGLLPGGRYWEATEEGYIPVSVAGLQFSPIRGSVLGRLRRLQRGAYPPKNDPNGPYPERLLGLWEAGTELAASLGFFPGLAVSTASEAILGLAGGGDIGDVPEKFVENLPAAMATVADGIIAASRVAGPEWTNKLAGTIFKSRYNDYYMTKALWDMHKVSPSEAKAKGHEDWIADAYHGVALRGMIEEQVSLTRFQPDSWKKIQDDVAKLTQDITGKTPEEQVEIKRRGRRLSEVVSLDRTDRARLSMIEGINALAEASVPLSDKERRRYLEASQDYYKTLTTFREASLEEQKADDAKLEANEIMPDEWRRNYSDRWSEYRHMAQNATEFQYFRKLGGTAEERHAIREKFGMAPMFANPVDDVLDRMFSMEPRVDYLGNEDWDGLFQDQDELIDTLPSEDAKKVRDYLKRNLTTTVQEFREGRRIAAPYKHPEKYVPAWYRSLGREDMAQMIEQAYVDLEKEDTKRQQMLLQGIYPPPGRRAQLASFLKKHVDEYKYRVAFVPGTPGYSPDILPFIRKFYGQVGPRA